MQRVVQSSGKLSGWYTAGAESRHADILKSAYNQALTIFEDEIGYKSVKFQASQLGLTQVLKTLDDARRSYEDKGASKCRKWLSVLSERLVHYQTIFDVLVQHHPEYVALVWGAFKFVFTTFVNHQECITKMSKALARIAACLPRVHLSAILYPTDDMQTAIAYLYAHILGFLHTSTVWYKKSKLSHAFSSVWQPWALHYEDQYNSILAASQRVDELASSGMQAETRDMHTLLQQSDKQMVALRTDIDDLKATNRGLLTLVEARFASIDHNFTALSSKLDSSFGGQRTTMSRVQVNQLLSLPMWSDIATAGESLEFNSSMDKRKRDRICLPPVDFDHLRKWAAQDQSRGLFTVGRTQNASRAFMLRMIELLRTSNINVIWALRYRDYEERAPDRKDILRMLTFQALSVNSESQLNTAHPITVGHLREAATDEDWLDILSRCLDGSQRTFLVIDPKLLSYVCKYDVDETTSLLDAMLCKLGQNVKFVVSTSNANHTWLKRRLAQEQYLSISTHSGDRVGTTVKKKLVARDLAIRRRRAGR